MVVRALGRLAFPLDRSQESSATLDWSVSVVGAVPGMMVTFDTPHEMPAALAQGFDPLIVIGVGAALIGLTTVIWVRRRAR